MRQAPASIGFILLVILALWARQVAAQDKVYTGSDGLIRITPFPMDQKYRHEAWPDTMEKSFWIRANRALDSLKNSSCNNTYFENEKSAYPHAMAKFLTGNRSTALSCLQGTDANANEWNQHTLGIDYFPCFTLKGQMRKYFWFGVHGGYLEAAYQKKMFDGAKIWTEQDPMTRLHPIYGAGSGEYGYTPKERGYWVDRRMTDNLRAMRDGSVYLMAEETGNDSIRLKYKAMITRYVRCLYHIGMSEWDSENYMGHTIAPYLNLYDFAKDPEVKMLARAALDWMLAAGALKYWRGGYGGPCARDYGGSSVVWGAGVSHVLGLYFGGAVIPDPDPHYDDVYSILSGYRPPAAIIALANKQFDRPVEMLNTKPNYYSTWPGFPDSLPQYYETLYWGKTAMLSSVISDTNGDPWDIAPCKLMAENSARGVDFFVPFTFAGTPKGRYNTKKTGDQIGQYRNLLIYLRKTDTLDFGYLLPKTASIEISGGVWYVKLQKTWLALYPINLGTYATTTTEISSRLVNEVVYRSKPSGAYAGFAMEFGESPESYESFKLNIAAKGKVDLSGISSGSVKLTGTDGSTLKLTYNSKVSPHDDRPVLERNGTVVNYATWLDVYKPVTGDAPVKLGWKQGTLTVTAGGHTFVQSVSADGKVSSVPLRGASPALQRSGADGCGLYRIVNSGVLVYGAKPGTGVRIVALDGTVVSRATIDSAGRYASGRLAAGSYVLEIENRSHRFTVAPGGGN